jgi:hypothetical protein
MNPLRDDDQEREPTPRELMKSIIARKIGAEEAELVIKRTHMRLGGATHEKALAAYPRLGPKLDRDGVVR